MKRHSNLRPRSFFHKYHAPGNLGAGLVNHGFLSLHVRKNKFQFSGIIAVAITGKLPARSGKITIDALITTVGYRALTFLCKYTVQPLIRIRADRFHSDKGVHLRSRFPRASKPRIGNATTVCNVEQMATSAFPCRHTGADCRSNLNLSTASSPPVSPLTRKNFPKKCWFTPSIRLAMAIYLQNWTVFRGGFHASTRGRYCLSHAFSRGQIAIIWGLIPAAPSVAGFFGVMELCHSTGLSTSHRCMKQG